MQDPPRRERYVFQMNGRSLLASLGLLAAVGCGGGDSGTPSSPSGGDGASVTVGNNFFSPVDISVPAGSTVTWTWAAGDTTHNVTFDDGSATSPTQTSGNFQRTFTAPGTFAYHCSIHGAALMHGTVTVTGAGTGGQPPGGGTGGGGMGGGGYP
ncbi:MAG TPA: plastocyanin/azurin family copper-binding protein [Gemmatimonadales bacterium]|nr:plastocyanin/azurin family copper-binding protein [Gemmatimonadales bacterium]